MLWRPQKQERLRREELLNNLKVGDKIMTIGGIYGTITDISEKKIKLLIADNVEIEMARSAVSGVQTL